MAIFAESPEKVLFLAFGHWPRYLSRGPYPLHLNDGERDLLNVWEFNTDQGHVFLVETVNSFWRTLSDKEGECLGV